MSTKVKLNGDWVDVANVSTSDVIRNPDWNRAITLTQEMLNTGYTCPEDGFVIVNATSMSQEGKSCSTQIKINGKILEASYYWKLNGSFDSRWGSLNVPVAKGDVLTVLDTGDVDMPTYGYCTFVPYKLTLPTSVDIVNMVANNNMNPVTSNAVYKNWKKTYGSAVVVNFTPSGTSVDSVSVANDITMMDGDGVNHNIGKGSAHAFHMLYTDKGYLVFIIDVTVVFAVQIGTILTSANN